MDNIRDLEPKNVFGFFKEICSIPHGSGNIQAISDYLSFFAKEHNLEHYQDELGNVVIFKDATPGYENAQGIIIQGHMDMVVAVETGFENQIDMTKDGLKLGICDDNIYAEHTTLGGDDGIAVAYGLALMASSDIPHPALEFIITVDEEVGMDGAAVLNPNLIRYKKMINIDNEVEGQIIAGCAGGGRVTISLSPDMTDIGAFSEDGVAVIDVTITGCIGGHSGVEIHRGRANTNIIAGRVLSEIIDNFDGEVYLTNIKGGTAENAIAPLTNMKIAVKGGKKESDAVIDIIKKQEQIIKAEFATVDPDMEFIVEKLGEDVIDKNIAILTYEATKKLADILMCVPNGVMTMSADVPGLVETSLNLGILERTGSEIQLDFAVRSSVESAKLQIINRLKAFARLAGGEVSITGVYPGWQYRVDSPLRDMCVSLYEKMYGSKPAVEAIHAGLECGFFLSKKDDLDCVSIGPNIYDIHTPRERLSISSTKRVWEFICEVLKTSV